MPRMAASDDTSYVTIWPGQMRTRAPAAGTQSPSQVVDFDHGPLAAVRITPSTAKAKEGRPQTRRIQANIIPKTTFRSWFIAILSRRVFELRPTHYDKLSTELRRGRVAYVSRKRPCAKCWSW